MTVVLNEAGIAALFESAPVVAFVERAAREEILPEMREDIRSYFKGAETTVEDDVDVQIENGRVIAGLRNDPRGRSTHTESKSARYARVGQWEKTRDKAAGGS